MPRLRICWELQHEYPMRVFMTCWVRDKRGEVLCFSGLEYWWSSADVWPSRYGFWRLCLHIAERLTCYSPSESCIPTTALPWVPLPCLNCATIGRSASCFLSYLLWDVHWNNECVCTTPWVAVLRKTKTISQNCKSLKTDCVVTGLKTRIETPNACGECGASWSPILFLC